MSLRVNIATQSKRDKLTAQVALFYWFLTKKKQTEIRVLSYMLKNNMNGIYLIKRGHVKTIATSVKVSSRMVKKSLVNLSRKGLIKFVTNGEGNNLGCYYFHKSLEQLCSDPREIIFAFINKGVLK